MTHIDQIPGVHGKHRILLLYLRIPFRSRSRPRRAVFDGLRQQQQKRGVIKMSLGMVMLTLLTKTASAGETIMGRTVERNICLSSPSMKIWVWAGNGGTWSFGPSLLYVVYVRGHLRTYVATKWKWIGVQNYLPYYIMYLFQLLINNSKHETILGHSATLVPLWSLPRPVLLSSCPLTLNPLCGG